ncbi:uncharacterized protein LOC144222040 isoform X2 [Crocuta crocuta]
MQSRNSITPRPRERRSRTCISDHVRCRWSPFQAAYYRPGGCRSYTCRSSKAWEVREKGKQKADLKTESKSNGPGRGHCLSPRSSLSILYKLQCSRCSGLIYRINN